MLSDFSKISVGGVLTSCLGREKLALLLGDYIEKDRRNAKKEPVLVFSLNGHSISEANSDPSYMSIMNKADIVHADGQSVVFFSKWLKGRDIEERTATTDMIHDLPDFVQKKLKHYLFGGKAEVVREASKIMMEKYTNFDVVGFKNGYFSEEDELSICNDINESGCDVLWVGLGKPKEQEFCLRNKERLNVSVIITCGGCYNFITGDYSRAPKWAQNIGVEWFHRVLTNPRKLLYRYLTTNPHAIYCVIKNEISVRKYS